jgi:ubiquinone/menaquinone biosynthesis C-methylase UbiE
MNERHLQLCASAEWAHTVREQIMPWVVGARRLGDAVLEVGPGPGLVTDELRTHVRRLTAVEVDQHLAEVLAARLADTNVEVVHADGAALPFPNRSFSGATCFTMLHHVPTAEHQDRLLGELKRVLRPGALLVGVDSLDRPEWRDLHAGDTCVPVDPTTFEARLERAGFTDVEVELDAAEPAQARRFRFSARA